MILIEKGAKSCLNWQFICKEKFPNEFSHSNVEEDFDLLFKDQVDHVKLKELFRTSVRDPNQAVRKFLWKRILFFDSTSSQISSIGDSYTQKVNVLFGKNLTIKAELPDFVDQDHLVFYYLNNEGKAAVSRLLNALAIAHPELTFAPLLVPLASLFLHYMNEPETYACLVAVVESKNKITQTDIHWSTTNNVFKRFAQKYSHFAYDYLLEGLYKETKSSEACFGVVESWHWWIFEYLPFNYVLNIVDSFLLEGQKVLYRFGLAILDNFYRYNHSLNVSHQPSLGVHCMKDFCNKAPVAYDRLIKTAFGYRNMSRKDVENIFQEEEKHIKKARSQSGQELMNKQAGAATQQHADYRKRFFSVIEPFLKGSLIEDGQSQTSQGDLTSTSASSQPVGNQLSTGNRIPSRSSWTNRFKGFKLIPSKKWYLNTSNSSTHSFYHHHHPQSSINLPSFSVENTGSSILVAEQIAQLWRWLPSRYQILELQLIYSTNIHGCRLMTLMDKIEYYTASLIVIQTTTNSIFGAYCSQPWSNRITHDRFKRVRFFGNGESFLFELSPNVDKYEWVGKHVQGQTEPGQELFQYADHDKLIVGGGANNGIGLLINSDLTYGRTDVSDTFANQILGTEKDFEIAILEVFSFNSS